MDIYFFQWITAVLAVIGVVFGVLNTMENFNRKKSDIKIEVDKDKSVSIYHISIINLSLFPITIIQTIYKNSLGGINTFIPADPASNETKYMPIVYRRKIESKDAYYFTLSNLPNESKLVELIIKTACGKTFKKKLSNNANWYKKLKRK